MANDDLDLIRLFGLSPEEASGLGLDPSERLPAPKGAARDAGRALPARRRERQAEGSIGTTGGMPERAEPVTPVPTPTPETHVPEAPGAAPHGDREDSGFPGHALSDELALLAMLESPEAARAPDYGGHGATRGLSLAGSATPPAGREPAVGGVTAPDYLRCEPAELDEVYKPFLEADADRIVWPSNRPADVDDNVDVVSLFDLTAEEAMGLGLAPRAEIHDTLAPPDHAPSTREPSASAFPTMHLHAIDASPRPPTGECNTPLPSRGEGEPAVAPLPVHGEGEPAVAPLPVHGEGEPAVAPLPRTGRVDARLVGGSHTPVEGEGSSARGGDTSRASIDEQAGVVAYDNDGDSGAQPAESAIPASQLTPPQIEKGAEPAASVSCAQTEGTDSCAQTEGTEQNAADTEAAPLPAAHGRMAYAPTGLPPGRMPYAPTDPALLDAFAEESAELLDGLHVELEHLESDVDDHGALLETRRIIHTIKGGAKMCGFEHVVLLTHSCENLLDLIADGVVRLDGQNLRALFECEPLLRSAVQDAITGGGANLDAVAALAARFDASCSVPAPEGAASEDASAAERIEARPVARVPCVDVVDAVATSPFAPGAHGADAPARAPEGTHVGSPTPPAVSADLAVQTTAPETDAVGADGLRPSSGAGDAAPGAADDPALTEASPAGAEVSAGSAPPAPGAPPARPRWLREAPPEVGYPRSGSEQPRVSLRSGRNANSINVDLSKVDAVVAKVTELAAHRVSSQGMIGRLLETSEDARRNVARLGSLAMQIGNECASIVPEETTHDDLELESYNALNTLVLQLQEAVSDQQALVQALHDTITSHWSLQASESRVDADIQSALMSIRLVPLASLRVRLDGVVRQAAEATGKLVRWQLQGSSVAVEKNVFDRLFEPLMHLLRNAVDHGLETPAERHTAGKHETGAITVTAAQEGNHIVITVADDGRGIVANKVAALAVERGLITAEQANSMTHQQKTGLIFTPGFSTAARVSHISGRGVGLDAVREACLRMGGALDVSSRPGTGTTFTMRLPLSLSVTRGLIIRDGGGLMVLPVAQVLALHLVPAADVLEVPGGRVARLEGQELPIYNLPPLAGAAPASYVQNGEVNVLQVALEGGSIGMVIEDVLGEEEILIKAPPALLRGVKTLLGAYMLPDGRVAPVVNLPQMLADLRPIATLTAPKEERQGQELRALIVDDSMSMRVALSGTLQNAGFSVLTARDGQEALELLKREGLPSLVTLDVEMPRMDGLETLFAIRQMAGAAELPVFMMTSRGGAKHRRAAEQLGATRYFTKPYRDSELATAAREACTHAIAS